MKLELNEGTVWGAQYWTVAPIFPLTAPPHTWFNPKWQQMLEWCIETYGPTPQDNIWTPGARWYVNNSRFWFKDSADREWFLLRWT